MDFRNVTDLFADPAFDGIPEKIIVVDPEEPIPPEEIINGGDDEEVIVDPEPPTGVPEPPVIIGGGGIISEPQPKVYVAGVDVSILNERVQHLDSSGKLMTESLKDYTKQGILNRFRSLDDFLSSWNSAEKKKAIIEELEAQGIIIENLQEEVKKELDIFDLICHIAWDKPALPAGRGPRMSKRGTTSPSTATWPARC